MRVRECRREGKEGGGGGKGFRRKERGQRWREGEGGGGRGGSEGRERARRTCVSGLKRAGHCFFLPHASFSLKQPWHHLSPAGRALSPCPLAPIPRRQQTHLVVGLEPELGRGTTTPRGLRRARRRRRWTGEAAFWRRAMASSLPPAPLVRLQIDWNGGRVEWRCVHTRPCTRPSCSPFACTGPFRPHLPASSNTATSNTSLYSRRLLTVLSPPPPHSRLLLRTLAISHAPVDGRVSCIKHKAESMSCIKQDTKAQARRRSAVAVALDHNT